MITTQKITKNIISHHFTTRKIITPKIMKSMIMIKTFQKNMMKNILNHIITSKIIPIMITTHIITMMMMTNTLNHIIM